MKDYKEIRSLGETLFKNPDTAIYKVWLESMLSTFGSRSRATIDIVWMELLKERELEEARQLQLEAKRRAKEDRGPSGVGIFFTTLAFRVAGIALVVAPWIIVPEPDRTKAIMLGSQTWIYVFLGLLIMAVSFILILFTALPIIIVIRAGIAYAVNLYFMRAMVTLRPAFFYMINCVMLSLILRGYYYALCSYLPWAEWLFWMVFIYVMITTFWRAGKNPENWVDFIDTQHRYLTPAFIQYLIVRAEEDGATYCFMDRA